MPLYEHVFIARQDISAQQAEGLIETYKTLLEEQGGSVAKSEYWGLRPLAYKIKKNRKAHYALMNIDAPHAAVAEMERQMGLANDIIRFLTIRVEEHNEKPSAILIKGDDRRGGRGGRFDRGGPRRGGPGGDPREKRDFKPESGKGEDSSGGKQAGENKE